MNCLECTAIMRATYTVRGAIGCCAYCGAGLAGRDAEGLRERVKVRAAALTGAGAEP